MPTADQVQRPTERKLKKSNDYERALIDLRSGENGENTDLCPLLLLAGIIQNLTLEKMSEIDVQIPVAK